MKPKVDVILPFDRIDGYLDPAIASINNSQDVVTRIIFVDDRKDGSKPITFARPSNSELIVSGGVGYGKAINSARDLLQGPFVGLMNSDDLIHPIKFTKQIGAMKVSGANLSLTQLMKFKGVGQRVVSKLGRPTLSQYSCDLLLLGAYGADATWLSEIDFWNSFSFSEAQSSDWTTAFQVLPKARVVGLDEVLYFYRIHGAQQTAQTEYSSNAFLEVYSAWCKYADMNSFKLLSEVQAALVCAPWSMQAKQSTDFDVGISVSWLMDFLRRTGKIHKPLIDRRLAYITFSRHRSGNRLSPLVKGGLSGLSSLILEGLKCKFQGNNLLGTLQKNS